ncbi:MAG TPA: TCP-1/cpn60 chaperonin family protein, partial [Halobacteriales archaeon]|nr:TCP-1/cpn60 chaperonin family protein [Halobacteriales archaeon]
IPRTLAVNLGMDPIDAVVDLRAAHDAGEMSAGLSVVEHGTADMVAEGVVEPLRVKTQAVSSAREAAQLILRIDDVVAAGNLSSGDDEDEDFDF